jgi:hypothetical protein
MSRYDFGPEVNTFYEIDCEGCGLASAVADIEAVFEQVTHHHGDPCPYPRRVTVTRRREVTSGEPWHWEIVISDPSEGSATPS